MSRLNKQLCLFEADIIAFPPSRRDRVVRFAAEEIDRIGPERAENFWREMCKQVARPLRNAGIPNEVIRIRMLEFSAAVEARLNGWAIARTRCGDADVLSFPQRADKGAPRSHERLA